MPPSLPPSPQALSSHTDNVVHSLQIRSRSAKKKKKNDPLEPYFNAARWIPLSVNPFISITTIIYAGLPDEDEEPDERYSQAESMTHEDVMKMVPTFKDVVTTLSKDPAQLEVFIAYLGSAAASARQEDTASLKHDILTYMLENPSEDHLYPPITKVDSKSARGFNHIVTAACLCPMDKYSKFLRDQTAFMDKVKDGTCRIKTSGWPRFLYDVAGNYYDPTNKDRGLFRGPVLVRAFRHIFTGPSSAFGSKRRGTKSSKAEIHQMTVVTGRMIAYAAVQTRFALSSVESWSPDDGEFNYERFFDNIVDLFETDDKDPWVVETLKWWQGQVPGLSYRSKKRKHTETLDLDCSDDDDAVTEILMQRQARRKQQQDDFEEDRNDGSAEEQTAGAAVPTEPGHASTPSPTGQESFCYPSNSADTSQAQAYPNAGSPLSSTESVLPQRIVRKGRTGSRRRTRR